MEKKNKECCSCVADLKKEVNELVNEVEGYTAADHTRKQAEVKAAFAHEMPHASPHDKKKGDC